LLIKNTSSSIIDFYFLYTLGVLKAELRIGKFAWDCPGDAEDSI
jgi:hypothetical protein